MDKTKTRTASFEQAQKPFSDICKGRRGAYTEDYAHWIQQTRLKELPQRCSRRSRAPISLWGSPSSTLPKLPSGNRCSTGSDEAPARMQGRSSVPYLPG